ncbi:hypothetical protein SM11_chr2614 [Sinorhizobium meliloti SM11]|uniref:Uncharacterized protein n=1 Tax=Sinorhizobium meliloti (strain SM11) TaxID=707241 RepID=F7X5N5_SINMM|nr:hypothetical protein SM11_chr2614 [Sinorhizobium meliloti SM11]
MPDHARAGANIRPQSRYFTYSAARLAGRARTAAAL